MNYKEAKAHYQEHLSTPQPNSRTPEGKVWEQERVRRAKAVTGAPDYPYKRPDTTPTCPSPYHREDWDDGHCPGCCRGRKMPPPLTEEERVAYRNRPLCPNEDCRIDEKWGAGCADCGRNSPYRSR